MIRKLTKEDNKLVMNYVLKEPEFNLFIIGDIESFGYDSDFQTLWGEFENNKLVSVLLKYRENLVYYSDEERSIKPYIELLNQLDFSILNGKKDVLKRFEEYLSDWKVKDLYFASLTEFKKEDVNTDSVSIIDTYDGFLDEWELLETIEEFSGNRDKKEDYAEHSLKISKEGAKTGYSLYMDDKMVSVASVVAETSTSGMIIGVATLKEYRKRGLASVVMNKLCDDYLNKKNKTLCLFFDNPKAGKIYHRLGFKDIGMYRMFEKVEK